MNPLEDTSRWTLAPIWLRYLLEWPEIDLTITYRRWLPGDENRQLPMPLRYAAAHPCSASATIGVLKGNN